MRHNLYYRKTTRKALRTISMIPHANAIHQYLTSLVSIITDPIFFCLPARYRRCAVPGIRLQILGPSDHLQTFKCLRVLPLSQSISLTCGINLGQPWPKCLCCLKLIPDVTTRCACLPLVLFTETYLTLLEWTFILGDYKPFSVNLCVNHSIIVL